MYEKKYNPCIVEYEKIHPESVIEWWCHEIFYKTQDDKKNWQLKATMTEFGKKNWCGTNSQTTYYDLNEKNHYDYTKYIKKKIRKTK